MNTFESFELKAFLLKVEAARGTDSVPTAGDNGLLLIDGSIELAADELDREIDDTVFGADPFVLVGRRNVISGSIEPYGASSLGTASPNSAAFRCAGLSETLTPSTNAVYAPISTGFESGSLYTYMGSQQIRTLGLQANLDFQMSLKNFFRAQAQFTGLQNLPTAATLPAVDLSDFNDTPPAIETETFTVTIDGFAANALEMNLNMNNDIVVLEGSETREVIIRDRKPTGEILIADPGVTAKDFFALAGTDVVIQAVIDGGSAQNKATMDIPVARLGLPQFANQDGVRALRIPYRALKNGSDGEFSLTLE